MSAEPQIDPMAVRRTIAGLDRIIRDLLLEREALAAKLPRDKRRRGDATSMPSIEEIRMGKR